MKFPDLLKTYMENGKQHADVVSDSEVKPGDELSSQGVQITITKIVEQRPAKGNWDSILGKGKTPTWYKCLCDKHGLVKAEDKK